MFTYTIEVSYTDGRCYSADTNSPYDAECAINACGTHPDVVSFAVRIADAGKAFLSQVYHAGRCTSAECKA